MLKTLTITLIMLLFSAKSYAYNSQIDKKLQIDFQKAWDIFCEQNPIEGLSVSDLGLVWATDRLVLTDHNHAEFIDAHFDNLAYQFMGDKYSADIFAKNSFARVSGDYLEKLYTEIRDRYIDLTAKELEKRSIFKPSQIKYLVELFKNKTSI